MMKKIISGILSTMVLISGISINATAVLAEEVKTVSQAQIQNVVNQGEKIVRSSNQTDFVLDQVQSTEVNKQGETTELRTQSIVSIITLSDNPQQAISDKIQEIKSGTIPKQTRDSGKDPSGTVTAYVDLAYETRSFNNGKPYIRIRRVIGDLTGFASGVYLVSHSIEYGQSGIGTNGLPTSYNSNPIPLATNNRSWSVNAPSNPAYISNNNVARVLSANYRVVLSRGTSSHTWQFTVNCRK